MEEQEISIFPEQRIVYAGFWQRFAATFIDGVILLIVQRILFLIMGAGNYIRELREYGTVRSVTIYANLIIIIIGWLYEAVMTASEKQATVGKLALGIKVTDLYGNRVSFAAATGRHFAKLVSTIIIFIGYFMMFWDEKKQTLHDKMAGTLVVKNESRFSL